MRIAPISNNNFKAIYKEPKADFTKEQEFIFNDIKNKCSETKYDKNESLINILENKYKMDLCVDANLNGKSVYLYIAEKANIEKQPQVRKLTPIDIYDDDNIFDVSDITNKVDKMVYGDSKKMFGSIAMTIFAIAATIITLVAGINAIRAGKSNATQKAIENVINTNSKPQVNILNLSGKIK